VGPTRWLSRDCEDPAGPCQKNDRGEQKNSARERVLLNPKEGQDETR
jgi:hypothetical protein